MWAFSRDAFHAPPNQKSHGPKFIKNLGIGSRRGSRKFACKNLTWFSWTRTSASEHVGSRKHPFEELQVLAVDLLDLLDLCRVVPSNYYGLPKSFLFCIAVCTSDVSSPVSSFTTLRMWGVVYMAFFFHALGSSGLVLILARSYF